MKRQLVPGGTEERWTTVQGHRLRYLEGGRGMPLIFVHGMMGYSFSWSENLAAFAVQYRVLAPDMLNLGFSDRALTDCSLKGYVRQLTDFMDAVGVESAIVVGSSHGATVALLMGALAPERVRAVVAVAPPDAASEAGRRSIKLFATRVGRALAPILRHGPRWAMWLAVSHLYGNPLRMKTGTCEGYLLPVRVPGTIEHWLRMAAEWGKDFSPLTAARLKPACPTLLVWGEKDRVVALREGKRLAAEISAPIEVIKSAGHLCYEELPDEFNRLAIDWLRGNVR